jgi:hypothetical protein
MLLGERVGQVGDAPRPEYPARPGLLVVLGSTGWRRAGMLGRCRLGRRGCWMVGRCLLWCRSRCRIRRIRWRTGFRSVIPTSSGGLTCWRRCRRRWVGGRRWWLRCRGWVGSVRRSWQPATRPRHLLRVYGPDHSLTVSTRASLDALEG